MDFSNAFQDRKQEIIDLFTASFTASEGKKEGTLIGGLVRSLLQDTAMDDIFVFIAEEQGTVVGAIVFTRLIYDNDNRTVFLLSPMAVATKHQGKGIGRAILNFALAELRKGDVDVVITYGDPAFYGKVGFMPLSETIAPAPLTLSYPHGWIGQSLNKKKFTVLKGPCSCVAPLNNPVFW